MGHDPHDITLKEKQQKQSKVSLSFDPQNNNQEEGQDFSGESAAAREELLKALPAYAVRKAWFTMAHLILEPGAIVADIGCTNGLIVYAMALMNPRQNFIGLDENKKHIKAAKAKYKLPNLKYIAGDYNAEILEEESLDAVISSFMLHEIYSAAHCSEKAVIETLEKNFSRLKPDGQIFIRDYPMPPPEQYVLLEMPDEPGLGDSPAEMSEADLLIHYSETARPRTKAEHCGFYLEELPARFPKTRLFRLPHKWAYEFLVRKDERENWNDELQKEYSFFTIRDTRKILRSLGARVLYTSPHWDDQHVKRRFDKKIKLFDEDGQSLGAPPTSFVAVAQKIGERRSQVLQERRPSRDPNANIRIFAMRDDVEGKVLDIVSRDIEFTEILPYRITEDGRLHIYVHDGLPRGIVNAVPRNGTNLDGKKWSGHMTEAIAVPANIVSELPDEDIKSLVKFSRDYLGLKPKLDSRLEDGPGFYPAPDYIDERIETKFLHVETPSGPVVRKILHEEIEGFSTTGRIREVDAQSILNAVGVGFIPSSRIELQVMALYEKLGLQFESWAESPLKLQEADPPNVTKLQEIIAKLEDNDTRYKEVKGNAGQLRTVNSVFVDEGQMEGGITGLASRELEFVVPEELTHNTAVVLPLVKSISGEVMAGIIESYLPVPQRYKGNSFMVSCPSFPLPKEITNFDMATKFVAEKFEVPVEHVARMGESYFCHVGVTPHRIFPFAVSSPSATGFMKQGRTHGATTYTPLYDLWKMLYWDNNDSFMKVVGLAYASAIGQDSDMSFGRTFSTSLAAGKTSPISLQGQTVFQTSAGSRRSSEGTDTLAELDSAGVDFHVSHVPEPD